MVSAVILAKNEEKNIGECIKSLAWCDEILVIDDNSGDQTVELAKKYGAKVYKRSLADDFAAQRNFGLDKAGGEWVLFVDADERISAPLAAEIQLRTYNTENSIVGFYIKRCDVMWGRELRYGEQGVVMLLRLARENAGVWRRRVHEVWNVQGRVDELENPILHYPHQSLREFIADVDFHSTLHAKANQEEGKRSDLLKILFYPPAKFIKNWVFKLGFLDGAPGFISAALMSFHSFLAWSKLWLMQKER